MTLGSMVREPGKVASVADLSHAWEFTEHIKDGPFQAHSVETGNKVIKFQIHCVSFFTLISQ